MAAVLTGTPTAVTWAAGVNPAGQSITIPADATAVYMFYTNFDTSGEGINNITLNGASEDAFFGITDGTGQKAATGVAVWYNPPTGSQTLDLAWNFAPTEGPTTIVAYVKDGDTTAWRDVDAAHNVSATAVSVTLTTVSGDLVLKYDQRFHASSTPPSLSASWSSAQTTGNNSEGARLSYISAAGTTVVCDSEDEDYSSVVAISIPAAGPAPRIIHPTRAVSMR